MAPRNTAGTRGAISEGIVLRFPWAGRYRFPPGFSFKGLDQAAADDAIRAAFEAANNKLAVSGDDESSGPAKLCDEDGAAAAHAAVVGSVSVADH